MDLYGSAEQVGNWVKRLGLGQPFETGCGRRIACNSGTAYSDTMPLEDSPLEDACLDDVSLEKGAETALRHGGTRKGEAQPKSFGGKELRDFAASGIATRRIENTEDMLHAASQLFEETDHLKSYD